mgnify:CR=1 FL=1
MSARLTICLNDSLYKFLKKKSSATGVSISHLVQDSVKASLSEDAIDLKAILERKREPEFAYKCVTRNLI